MSSRRAERLVEEASPSPTTERLFRVPMILMNSSFRSYGKAIPGPGLQVLELAGELDGDDVDVWFRAHGRPL